MKQLLALCLLSASTVPALAATTLASWNFNTDDGLVNTGTLTPAEGAGSLGLVGGATSFFTSGSPGDAATFPLDSGWSVGGYPTQGSASGTVGMNGFVSTSGYGQVVLSFDYQTQPSGNKWFLVQASGDHGASWVDVSTFGVAAADQWATQTVDISSAVSAVNNQAGFGFRVVAVFKPGTSQYEAAEASYNGDFGLVYDRLTVQASAVPEPDAVALLLAGVGCASGLAFKRQRGR